jgi:hypothetical protein
MSTKTNLVLDLSIFTVFLVVASPALTGNTIHEWLAVVFAAAIITHLLFHWEWLAKIFLGFFKKLFHQSRLNFVVDALFFVAMTASIFSGLMISKSVLSTLGIQLDVSQGWKSIHTLSSDASIILLGVHSALHWKWIVDTFKRFVLIPLRGLSLRPRTLAAQPVKINKEEE